jgi:hypothetical protein
MTITDWLVVVALGIVIWRDVARGERPLALPKPAPAVATCVDCAGPVQVDAHGACLRCGSHSTIRHWSFGARLTVARRRSMAEARDRRRFRRGGRA